MAAIRCCSLHPLNAWLETRYVHVSLSLSVCVCVYVGSQNFAPAPANRVVVHLTAHSSTHSHTCTHFMPWHCDCNSRSLLINYLALITGTLIRQTPAITCQELALSIIHHTLTVSAENNVPIVAIAITNQTWIISQDFSLLHNMQNSKHHDK